MNDTINALVVEDHPIYRKGIVKIISGLKFVKTCDEAENGQIAVDAFKKLRYDVVFLDISMPVMDGLTVARILKEKYPKTIIIVLTFIDSKKQIIEILEMGVNGYLLKSAEEDEIIKALNIIAEGRQYFTDEVYKIWADHCVNKSSLLNSVNKEPRLSKREIEIVRLLCEQHTANDIANYLCVSNSTVNNHRSHIMQKIGVDNTVGVVLYAIEHGIFVI